MYVEGFTEKVNYYMSLSDFFIGKPGPASISEALHFNLPVIVERNGKTLPQERYNTDWVRANQAGVVLKSFREIEYGLRDLESNGGLDHFRSNVAAHPNRAVFEVVDILSRLMPPADPISHPVSTGPGPSVKRPRQFRSVVGRKRENILIVQFRQFLVGVAEIS